MVRNLLSSTAHFSPPDDLGGGAVVETPVDVLDHGVNTDVDPAAERTSVDQDKPRVESVSDSIRRALIESKNKARDAAAKKSTQTDGAKTGDTVTAKSSSETTQTGNTETAPQGKSGAPQAWKAEEKALWDSLPEVARAAITRREADTAKGVQELRQRYQDVDAAIAPYQAVMTQNRVTPGQAINQLFKWHMELAGPNKVEAFKTLAKNFGVDPATLAAAQTSAAPGADPTNSIPENLRPVISGLETRIKGFEDNVNAQAQLAAQQTWANWSKDKPHAEKVRALMANLINSDLALMQAGQPQISNTIKNGSIDMDRAYESAVYAHPEVRIAVMQDEQLKRDAAAKAAAVAARKAGTSLRSGAPAGAMNGNSSNAPKVETARESIMRAFAEVRGTQH